MSVDAEGGSQSALVLIRDSVEFRADLLSFLYQLKKNISPPCLKVTILVQGHHPVAQCFLNFGSFKNSLIIPYIQWCCNSVIW